MHQYNEHLLNVFGEPQRVLERGQGTRVWDSEGREYLDFLAGIAVNSLGHAHPAWVQAVSEQAGRLAHVSNLFTTNEQIELAELLKKQLSLPQHARVFFSNSGTESNEYALKLSRLTGRTKVVALTGSFHGRSTGALSLTANPTYRTPFEPLSPTEFITPGDIAAAQATIDAETAMVIVEPIQGEAGVYELSAEYLQTLRELCTQTGALLVLDEIQSGLGRSGDWLGAQTLLGTTEPIADIITLAKGLGGGFPIGALLCVSQQAVDLVKPGQHGTTYGGNPLACAAAIATINTIADNNLLTTIRERSSYLRAGLESTGLFTQIRGRGLLVGAQLPTEQAKELVATGLRSGFIMNAPRPDTLRLAPPFIISESEIDSLITFLTDWNVS